MINQDLKLAALREYAAGFTLVSYTDAELLAFLVAEQGSITAAMLDLHADAMARGAAQRAAAQVRTPGVKVQRFITGNGSYVSNAI